MNSKENTYALYGLCIAPFILTFLSARVYYMNSITLIVTFLFWAAFCLWVAWQGSNK